MLKIEIGADHNKIQVEASGKTGTIITELAIGFNILFRQMTENNPAEAEMLKGMLKFAIMDDDSPFWKDLHLPGDGTAVSIKLPN